MPIDAVNVAQVVPVAVRRRHDYLGREVTQQCFHEIGLLRGRIDGQLRQTPRAGACGHAHDLIAGQAFEHFRATGLRQRGSSLVSNKYSISSQSPT